MKFQAIVIGIIFLAAFTIGLLFNQQEISYAQNSPPPVPTVDAPTPPAPPDDLPDTAAGALPYVREWLLFVAALLSTHIMNGVKKWPWLGRQEWFLKLLTELVSGVTASVVAFVLGNVAVALGFLDASGLWQVILFSWPAAVGLYHGKKFGKVKATA